MPNKIDHLITRFIISIIIAAFVVGVVLIVLGYYYAEENLTWKSKFVSAKISTLMVTGISLVVFSIMAPFIGPAIAKRISGKK